MVALHGHLHLHTTMVKSLGSQAHGFDSHHFTEAHNMSRESMFMRTQFYSYKMKRN
jgi:hypothetical protein